MSVYIGSENRAIFTTGKTQGSDIMTDKQKYQLERWKLLIADEEKNNMKLKDWLNLRGITRDAYYYWLHKLQREEIDTAICELPTQIQETSTFVEISKPESKQSSVHENVTVESFTHPAAIIKNNQFQVELYSTASSDMIREIMRMMNGV